jgi:hypothetical protein
MWDTRRHGLHVSTGAVIARGFSHLSSPEPHPNRRTPLRPANAAPEMSIGWGAVGLLGDNL